MTERSGVPAAEGLGQLWLRACALAGDFGLLVAMDVRRSLHSAVEAICVAVAAAVLCAAAWIAVMAALIGLTAEPAASWALFMLGAGSINLALSVAMGFWVRRKLRELPFSASLRQLRAASGTGGPS